MRKNSTGVGSRQLKEDQVLRLGRSLRRISRTCRDLMRTMDLKDEEVRIPRKKRRSAKKQTESSEALG